MRSVFFQAKDEPSALQLSLKEEDDKYDVSTVIHLT